MRTTQTRALVALALAALLVFASSMAALGYVSQRSAKIRLSGPNVVKCNGRACCCWRSCSNAPSWCHPLTWQEPRSAGRSPRSSSRVHCTENRIYETISWLILPSRQVIFLVYLKVILLAGSFANAAAGRGPAMLLQPRTARNIDVPQSPARGISSTPKCSIAA